jgi:hypothetical protein
LNKNCSVLWTCTSFTVFIASNLFTLLLMISLNPTYNIQYISSTVYKIWDLLFLKLSKIVIWWCDYVEAFFYCCSWLVCICDCDVFCIVYLCFTLRWLVSYPTVLWQI